MDNDTNKYWDGNSSEDIADEISELYERVTGKSSVYWSPLEIKGCLGKDTTLADRPETYSTEGFTCDYECWGREMCDKAVASGMHTRDMVIGWITGRCQRRVYAYFIEDHDGEYDNAVSAEDGVLYGYWQVDDVYGDLESARERMRQDFVAYRDRIVDMGGEIHPDRFKWRETTYCGRRVWECVDTFEPKGWKIVEQEVR